MTSRRKILRLALPFILGAACLLPVASGTAQTKQHHSRSAGINQKRAEQIALANVPGGKIRSAELTGAGNQRFWAVFVMRPNSKNAKEIHVDARSGKILKVQTEKPEDQAEEPAKGR
jgi:Peptidase propeptide and YPEB domain